jgi:hypothetical protein
MLVRGYDFVATITGAGYSNWIAVTSIWQGLPQEVDVAGDEVGVILGVIVRSTVRSTVVGTYCVDVMVDNIVDTTVLGGRCVVRVVTVPGRDTVVVTIAPGSVSVDKIVLIEVETIV